MVEYSCLLYLDPLTIRVRRFAKAKVLIPKRNEDMIYFLTERAPHNPLREKSYHMRVFLAKRGTAFHQKFLGPIEREKKSK